MIDCKGLIFSNDILVKVWTLFRQFSWVTMTDNTNNDLVPNAPQGEFVLF